MIDVGRHELRRGTLMRTLFFLLLVLSFATGCEQAECLANCSDRYEQVCGDDNVTYLNACEANCSGTTVDYAGPCAGDEQVQPE